MSEQNKEIVKAWIAGAKYVLMTIIGIITCAGAFNWASSNSGEGAFWAFGGITAIFFVVYLIKNIKAERQALKDKAAARKAAVLAEQQAKIEERRKKEAAIEAAKKAEEEAAKKLAEEAEKKAAKKTTKKAASK